MDQVPTFRVAKRTQLWETVLESLRTAIVNGTLGPGAQIIETEIAEAMSVSRWPVRQAITRLEQEHLVVTYPNRGAFVVGMTQDDIREIYSLRQLLELYGLRQALPKLQPADLEEMQRLIDDMEASIVSGNVKRFTDSDLTFHRKILIIAGSQRLIEMWEMLARPLRPLLIMGATSDVNVVENMGPRHQTLVAAYRSKDITQAEQMLKTHLVEAERRSLLFMQTPAKNQLSEDHNNEEETLAQAK